jgi:hypothetical protein
MPLLYTPREIDRNIHIRGENHFYMERGGMKYIV